MDLKFITSPEEDAFLQQESDRNMIGRGSEKQPSLEEFADTYLHAYLSRGVEQIVIDSKSAIVEKIRSAPTAKLAAIAAAIDAEVSK